MEFSKDMDILIIRRKQLIKELKLIEDGINKLWVKPNCQKCIHKNSPCVPGPFDCTLFMEHYNMIGDRV